MIIHKAWIARLFRYHITLFPFICFIYSKEELITRRGKSGYDALINHEKIHIKQQKECLVISFYIIYLLNWIINIFIHGKKAYTNISFEREAYQNDDNQKYLQSRKPFSWLKYIRKKEPRI